MIKSYLKKQKIDCNKKGFFKRKILENICWPKELWESFKYLGMPNKILISNLNVMEDNKTLTFDNQSVSTVFKNFFSNLAESLLTNLLYPPDKYDLESIAHYYSSFKITYDFCLNSTSEDKVLKLKKSRSLSLLV